VALHGGRCAINGTSIPCKSVVSYLSDLLHVPSDSRIFVTAGERPEPGALESMATVMNDIKTAGFLNVGSVGYITEPPAR